MSVTGEQILRNCNSSLLPNANRTALIVNDIFSRFPNRFRFTSGCRTAAENARVNGVSKSFHLKAQAADFVHKQGSYSSAEKEQLARILERYGYEVFWHNAGSGYHYHIEPNKSGVIYPVIIYRHKRK
jgi:hypothetical protein